MSRVLKKCLAYVLGITVILSNLSFTSLAESVNTVGGTASTGDIIDLSHDNPSPWGASFGIAADAQTRWQTFKATKDGTLDAVEVVLNKMNPGKAGLPTEVIAKIYTYQNNTLGSVLHTATIASDQITSQAVTRIDFAGVSLQKDKMYALALTANPMGIQDNDHARYDWANRDIGLDNMLPSGKIKNGNQVIDETQWVHTYWTKVYYQKQVSQPIDYTFEGTRDWGFSFGVADAVSRWQTFTSNVTDRMTSFDVYLIKKNQFGLVFPNIVATLYEVENNVPSKVLTTITKPSGDIGTNGVTTIAMQYNLEKNKQYAIGLSTDDVKDEDPSTATCYDWPTSDKGLSGQQFFGKTKNSNMIDESGLGTGYLKIRFDGNSTPEDPKATTIDLTVDKTILSINETVQVSGTVRDQYGDNMDQATIAYTSSNESVANITSTGSITALAKGTSKMIATSGGASSSLTITVKDGSGSVIPAPGMVIVEDTVLTPGVYDFEGSTSGITIKGNNITVDGIGVRILNASSNAILEDVTTGAYAYKLNAAMGKDTYNLTRLFDFTASQNITFSYDARADQFCGKLKVSVSEDKNTWTDVLTKSNIGTSWQKHTVNLNTYAGKKVYVRLSYDRESNSYFKAKSTGLKIDTIELVEDGVRTFSDLAEAKVFYLWEVSYDQESPVSDSKSNKPFDRTTYDVNTNVFKGTAITIEDSQNVVLKGLTVSGFYYALEANRCENLTIMNNNFSNNYTNPNGGWGDQDGGAVVLNGVNNSTIKNNIATNNANGLSLRQSNHNTVKDNNFSVCSDVALEMWEASYNTIKNNDFSWGIRIDPLNEVHARDSTSSLIEAGSNYNYVKKNDFTHGGDGIFIRALNGYVSEGNVFEENDTSFANNNAVESGMGRNYYIRNKANYSSYGFWLGGSDESTLIGNEIAYNGIKPANAPENFGNAGISMKYWSSEHMVIVNNNIHDNNGSGIGMSYKDNQPSYHALIQNNRIVNNTKYPIHLDRAEWFEINGNLIEGNGNNNQIYTSSKTKNIIVRDGASYQANYDNYLQEAPTAIITVTGDRFRIGETITFTAANSADPKNRPLTYRWDMGDGTILTGETVQYVYKTPGFYDVAITATNGTWSGIDWANVNVVAAGNEIGTEDVATAWEVTTNNGKTLITNDTPNMDIPQVGGTSLVDYPMYYVVDGNKSIKMSTTVATNVLTYPKSKNGNYDFSDDTALTFSMKVRNQNRDNSQTPIVTIYTDANNYVTYTPTNPILSPFKYVDFTKMQYRHEWYAPVIPFEGNSQWTKKVTGNPDYKHINYISLKTVTGGTMGLDLWIDGMKTIPKGDLPYYGTNIAGDGTVVVSSTATGTDKQAPVSDTISSQNKWASHVESESIYGVTFSVARDMNELDAYVYYKPTGQSGDTIGLPTSYTVEYLHNGSWTAVTNMTGVSLVPDKNVMTFDTVTAKGLRIRITNSNGKSASLYGFKVFDHDNIVAERNNENQLVTKMTASASTSPLLESIDMYICIDKPDEWPASYTDFKVYLHEISEDGKGPAGSPLASGTLTKATIISGGLNKSYTITMRDTNNQKVALEPGKRYVIGATQATVNPGGDTCYRWPTSKSTGVAYEDFGKYTYSNGTVSGFGNESFLGTGYLRVHTDQDQGTEATVDYAFSLNHSTGYGVGHAGEDCRYQTFTMPQDQVLVVADGAVTNDVGWQIEGAYATNTLTMTFKESKSINEANVYFATLPNKMVIKADGEVLATKMKSQLLTGFNRIALGHNVVTDKLTIEFVNEQYDTFVKEIEIR